MTWRHGIAPRLASAWPPQAGVKVAPRTRICRGVHLRLRRRSPDRLADHEVRPVLGCGSALVAIVAALLLTWASLRHGLDPRWWSVLGPLLFAGVLIGSGWRVFTAGVIGANIGAGLVIFFVGPVVMALLAWAMFRSFTLLR